MSCYTPSALTKPLHSNHIDRQARTRDTVLVKSREMPGLGTIHCHGF